ncbi:MAG: glycosyltransferase family 2 protein [Candidatus Zambryskibacteria bacterium]|nr:glycosyltransferase family 2 protein [Candidatus Zambryskibacteria bacterium]
MNPTSIPEISVIILCYKSGDFAKIFYKKITDVLKKNNLAYEIVLVGNYRPNTGDTTPDVLRKIKKEDSAVVTVIKEKTSPDQGMSWDMRCGLEAATGKSLAVIDGDGQMSPEDIPRAYKKLINENLDICKGRRISREDGLYRKFISRIYNMIMNVLFPGIVSDDINGKPKIFTRKAYDSLQLESNGWFIDAEIMIRAKHLGLKVGEVDVEFHENKKRKSFISFDANIEFIKNIFIWRMRESRILKK